MYNQLHKKKLLQLGWHACSKMMMQHHFNSAAPHNRNLLLIQSSDADDTDEIYT